jgi:hypothetical protein
VAAAVFRSEVGGASSKRTKISNATPARSCFAPASLGSVRNLLCLSQGMKEVVECCWLGLAGIKGGDARGTVDG